LAPTNNIESLEFDINLNFFYPLFERPGGKKVDALNNSVRLFEVKRALASAIYREEQLSNTYLEVIFKEIIETARCYLNQAIENNSWSFLLDESPKNSKNNKYITLASWIKHVYRFLKYLATLEVYTVPQQVIEVQMKALQPYFTADSGINSLEKAFAFLLGILFGKVVLVQGARGVNLQSNALTWLKRLNLTGKDLPELYIKIREKLLAYETSNNPDVQVLEKEIAKIALKLGSDIKLSNIDACYFLLLGQSVSRSVLPTKRDKEEINELETVSS
jgi:CRISPR-associated protein Csh1